MYEPTQPHAEFLHIPYNRIHCETMDLSGYKTSMLHGDFQHN